MAISKDNVVIHGLSGKFGDLIVFRQRHGKTLATQPRRGDLPISPAQQAVRDRFQRAVLYGKKVMADASSKAAYDEQAEGDKTAYNVAIADFLNGPHILEIDVSGYTGQVQQPIKVHVEDDFNVKGVNVAIYNPDGTIVDGGPAMKDPNSIYWIFTTQVNNPDLSGDKIVVEATDNPENLTNLEKVL